VKGKNAGYKNRNGLTSSRNRSIPKTRVSIKKDAERKDIKLKTQCTAHLLAPHVYSVELYADKRSLWSVGELRMREED